MFAERETAASERSRARFSRRTGEGALATPWSLSRPKPDAISSYFCTGGTTGSPKIARRTHVSEAFDAWAMTCFNEDRFGPGKTIFCGLPLFHVNGQLVTGLAPWSKGAHVVMATPQGYRGEGVIANFWALGRAFSRHHVLRRSDRLFGAPADADRGAGHQEPGSGDLRRGPDARATVP